jgi:dipeptidyl aminopeptidase/acylaminoacyl peptidase
MGGSEGALIANLLAAENELVTAVVAFNGGGRWFVDDVLHNIASEYVEKEEAENSLNGFKEFYQHILTSNADELVVSGHGYSWWKQMFEIDQFLVLNDVERPLLLVQGGIDKSVSPEKFNEMMSELTDAGKENIDHLFYQYLNHSFKTAEGVHKQDDVVSEMQHWLRGILGDSE